MAQSMFRFWIPKYWVLIMIECTPVKVLQLVCWPTTPLLIGLTYDHLHPSDSQQLASSPDSPIFGEPGDEAITNNLPIKNYFGC